MKNMMGRMMWEKQEMGDDEGATKAMEDRDEGGVKDVELENGRHHAWARHASHSGSPSPNYATDSSRK